MPFTGPPEDRMAIRELYSSFSYASTRKKTDEWLACWAEDAQWNTDFFQCSGKREVREQWDSLWANFDQVAFLCEVGSIEVDGDTASTGCTVREIIQLSDGGVYKLAGLYDDRLVRQNGQWLIARRDYQLLVEELPVESKQ